MKNNFTILHKLCVWIVNCWYRTVPNSLTISTTWINQVEKMVANNGTLFTIAYIKMIRQVVLSYLSGNQSKTVPMIMGINRNNCLPKRIDYMHSLIQSGDTKSIRFVLTLLSISRALPGWKTPDLTPIEAPFTGVISDGLISYIPKFLEELKFDKKQGRLRYSPEDIRFSTKAGPNGMSSPSAWLDLYSLPENLHNVLSASYIGTTMKKYTDLLSKSRVLRWYTVIKTQKAWRAKYKETKSPMYLNLVNLLSFTPLITTRIRKLSVVQDPEAKSRIIAILDFWSQEFLKGIHDIQFRLLSQIPTDMTYTQDPRISNRPEGHKLYSFDLTSATDRFPIALQRELIREMFGAEVASTWESVLVDYPYDFKLPNGEIKSVYYRCGQPMGAYSSWSTFTLTHHLILYYIHHTLNLKELFYKILGDDIVIYHDDVAKAYLDMMRSMDVGISLPKSHISSNMYEFAKRLFLDGKEITGIQLRGFLDTWNKYWQVYPNLYTLIYGRGYFADSSIPAIISQLYHIMGYEKRRVENLRSRSTILHCFNRYINEGYNTPLIELLKQRYPNYEGQLDFPPIELNNLVYLALNKTNEVITADYIKFVNNVKLNAKMVNEAAIGLADGSDIWTHPLFYIYNSPFIQGIMNSIGALSRARNLDSIKEIVRALALPNPNAFEQRASIRLAGVQSKIAKVFMAEVDRVVQGRLANMPSPPMQSFIGPVILSDWNKIKTDRVRELLPPAPKPKAPPKVDFTVAMW